MRAGACDGIDLDRAAERPHRGVPVPVASELEQSQRRMRFGQPFVERQRPLDGGLRDRERVARPHQAVEAEERIRVGETGVREREVRIDAERLFEALARGLQSAFVALAPEEAALQAQMERAAILPVARRQPRLGVVRMRVRAMAVAVGWLPRGC